MKTPFLIVETPRAGDLGHALIGPLEPPSAFLVRRFVRAGVQHPVGRNFIAACHEVEQQVAGGAVRTATETLVLVGVDVARLKPLERDQCVDRLQQRLQALGPDVVDRQTWTRTSAGTLVTPCSVLESWCQADGLDHLPQANIDVGPLLWEGAQAATAEPVIAEPMSGPDWKPPPARISYSLKLVGAGLLCVGFVLAAFGTQGWLGSRHSGTAPSSRNRSGLDRAKFTALAREFGVDDAVLAQEIHWAMVQDSGAENPAVDVEELLKNNNVQRLIDRPKPDIDGFLSFVNDKDYKQCLKEFLPASPGVHETREARRGLRQAAKELQFVRKQRPCLERTEKYLTSDRGRYPIFQLMLWIGRSEAPDDYLKPVPWEPATPIFHRSEACAAKTLVQAFLSAGDLSAGDHAPQNSMEKVTTHFLARKLSMQNRLALIREHKQQLEAEIKQERHGARGWLDENKVAEQDKERLTESYKHIKELLVALFVTTDMKSPGW